MLQLSAALSQTPKRYPECYDRPVKIYLSEIMCQSSVYIYILFATSTDVYLFSSSIGNLKKTITTYTNFETNILSSSVETPI